MIQGRGAPLLLLCKATNTYTKRGERTSMYFIKQSENRTFFCFCFFFFFFFLNFSLAESGYTLYLCMKSLY